MLPEPVRQNLQDKLTFLYGPQAGDVLSRLEQLAAEFQAAVSRPGGFHRSGGAHRPGESHRPASPWDERDVLLITYADQIRDEHGQRSPLPELNDFLLSHHLQEEIRLVHLLPFFPYSSDDGFSVIDYRQVNPAVGDWPDVRRLEQSFRLMFDLVLNHCSTQHEWFRKFREGVAPYTNYFIVPPPEADLSQVVRPRSTPLLTEFETALGPRRVWTTFSADQVDLNYACPDVLLEMLSVLLFYVQQGARIIRLDAIAYLWKEWGTPCIHLPQTHTVVKLMRALLDAVAPGTLLLTETNVPHRENISYFGQGDEAQLVYQFSLAPLLLDALLNGDAGPFQNWLRELEPPPPGTTFLNFTASHDGIGVRPLEGLVSPERLERLIAAVQQRGGLVSTRRRPDGQESPYELNITYFSALSDPETPDPQLHIRRFLTSQAVMLSLAGIPAVYFHSLVGTPNDDEGVRHTGQARSINRRKFRRGELEALLSDSLHPAGRVFAGYRHLLQIRQREPAFHPDAPQRVVEMKDCRLISFLRGHHDEHNSANGSAAANSGKNGPILVVANVSAEPVAASVPPQFSGHPLRDVISGRHFSSGSTIDLAPWEIVWLKKD